MAENTPRFDVGQPPAAASRWPAWEWPDARGWIGVGTFLLTCAIFAMTAAIPALRENEYFKTLGTLVVGAYIKDVVGWAYSATKGGTELAQRNADLVEAQAKSNPPIADDSVAKKP